jgi:CBS domain-containing protein
MRASGASDILYHTSREAGRTGLPSLAVSRYSRYLARGARVTIEEALKEERLGNLPMSRPAAVQRGTSVRDTLEAMRRHDAACALVCEGERLVGIFTERDVLNKLFGAPVDEGGPIDRYMTPDPEVLGVDDRLGDAIRLMTERGYRHVPLCDRQGKRVGMITSRDVVQYVAEHFPAEVVNLPPMLHQTFITSEGG